jgi:hypothetical protein
MPTSVAPRYQRRVSIEPAALFGVDQRNKISPWRRLEIRAHQPSLV